MVIVVVGLLVNLFVFWIFYWGSDEKNLNVCVVVLYVMGDLLGFVGVIVVVLIIIWMGWMLVDLIFFILVLVLVLCSVWCLLKDSVNELLEGVLVLLDINVLQCYLSWEIFEVCNVYYVYVWMVGEKLVMILYVQVILLYDYDVLLECIQDFLMYEYYIVYVMIQMEY